MKIKNRGSLPIIVKATDFVYVNTEIIPMGLESKG